MLLVCPSFPLFLAEGRKVSLSPTFATGGVELL